jgi:biopolymer transport protein ExbB/TolQ
MPEKKQHHLFLSWLIFTCLLVFALFISWQGGYLSLMYAGDKSKISWIITLLYLYISMHCAWRIVTVSRQLNATQAVRSLITSEQNLKFSDRDGKVVINNKDTLPKSLIADYIHDLIHKYATSRNEAETDNSNDNKDLIEVYESRLKGQHEIGWFVSDLMIKLGLLGTIVGFVLMLASVANVTDFDVSSMQSILKKMSTGMGTALYTTFAGLICSILTASQYYMLDQAAEEILETTKHLSQVYVLPRL